MSKWSQAEKVLVGSLLALITFLIIVSANAIGGDREVTGPEFMSSYNYCAQWQSSYKQQTCIRYVTGQERRVPVRVHGLFWDYDSYNVVR